MPPGALLRRRHRPDEIVSLFSLLVWFAALWWGLAVLLLLASFIAALLFPHLPWQGPEAQPLRPVTAIVPLKHFNSAFVADQTSLFTQDYSGLEILFTSAETRNPWRWRRRARFWSAFRQFRRK